MQLLIIDNGSIHIDEIIKYLRNRKIKLIVLPYNQINLASVDTFDGVILSGSSSLSVNHKREYKKEIKLIKTTKKPILGICLGFELICSSFNETVIRFNRKVSAITKIEIIIPDSIIEHIKTDFKAYESHRWGVNTTNHLISIAKSKKCIEIVKHKSKLIYGVQFHPEHFISKTQGYKILDNFIKIVKNINKL